ncbi:MAG: hypothetical protein E7275_12250 [Pseudobutyrivibrio sp.]|uniref:hypothetical protein n=1 Tax=Pseudobutyrivibrio sp. TaxID=2014367 RepID=UPI0025EF48F1|nr:hypothetical protein [Pseudobutyrivibrio sp.]MBE5905037.1 hypothetical protein [Pseudobutyrivibrio sp.]
MGYSAEDYAELMTTSDYLDQENLKSQSTVAISWLERHNNYLQTIENTYKDGSNIDMLGETYKGICKQCSSYVDIIEVLKTANDCDKMDHQYLKAVLGSMTFRGLNIISCACAAHRGEDNERSLADADRYAASIAEHDSDRQWHYSCAAGHDRNADSYKEEYERMEKYMRRFHRVNELTKNLFTLGNEYRAVAKQGMESIAWTYDPDAKIYSAGDESWKAGLTPLNEKYNGLIENRAKKIGESWSVEEASAILKKDAVNVTDVEYLALCYAFDGMSEKEMAEFIDSAYSETGYTHAVHMDYHDGGDISKAKMQFTASETFIEFSAIYRSKYNSGVEGVTAEQLYRNNILYVFAEVNPVLYTAVDEGDHVKNLGISVSSSKDESNQVKSYLTITIGADSAMSGQTEGQKYRIHCYPSEEQYMDEFVDLTIEESTRYKTDGREKSNSVIFAGGETAMGLLAKYGEMTTFGIGAFELLRGYCSAEAAEKEAIKKSEFTREYLDLGNLLMELNITGTVINDYGGGDDKVYITNVQYDENRINEAISSWNKRNPNEKIDCTAQEFVNTFLGQDNAVSQELMDKFCVDILSDKLE